MDLLLFPVMLFALLAPAALFRGRHQLPEALALGALVSLALWSVIAFGRFLLLLPPSSSRTLGLFATALTLAGGLGIASLCLRRPRQAVRLAENSRRQVLVLICGAVLLAMGVEATLPHFGIANLYYDWWEHFDLARFYSNGGDLFRHYQDGYTVTSRTPVFNLLTGLCLTAFGDRF
ncbi:MAG TPA: hypothetical protein VGD57_01515, partial [Candidatus Dormibacteraeota bacterium]